MKIPNKLKINGIDVAIKIEDRTEHGASEYGSALCFTQTIWLNSSGNKEYQELVLFHEIIELLNEENDMNLTHQNISTLATSLYTVLKDNKLIS